LEGKLGDDGSVTARDFFGEGEVFGWVDLHETGAEDADGAAFRGDGPFVGGGIDTACES